MNLTRALAIESNQSLSESELCLLAELASNHKIIIEVGTFRGRSTRAIADNTRGIVICVDPWNGLIEFKGLKKEVNGYNNEFRAFKENLKDHLSTGKVNYFIGKFKDFWPIYQPDMIFIDAIHEYNSVIEDIGHARNIMEDTGLLCGHDYADYWPGVAQAVDEIFPNRIVKDSIWYVEL